MAGLAEASEGEPGGNDVEVAIPIWWGEKGLVKGVPVPLFAKLSTGTRSSRSSSGLASARDPAVSTAGKCVSK